MALEVWRPRYGLMQSPLRELTRMERAMEDMFGRFFRDWPWADEGVVGWAPAVDMFERKDEIVVRTDVPGLEEKDIEVTVQDGMLTVRGERKEEREEKKENYYYAERSVGTFMRSLPLPPGVEADKVKATCKKGVLEIHIPKTKEATAKKIEVKAA